MTNIIDLSQFGELSEQELLLIEGGIGAIAYGGTTFVKGVSEFIENIQ